MYRSIREFFISYHPFDIETEHPEDCQWEQEKREKSASTSESSNLVEWPQHVLLVLPPAGKSLLLSNQHDYVGHVVRHAISKLTEETLLVNAFLDVDKKINYHRRLLIKAVHKLMSGIPPIGDIHDHLKEDMGFCDALGKLVCGFKSFLVQ